MTMFSLFLNAVLWGRCNRLLRCGALFVALTSSVVNAAGVSEVAETNVVHLTVHQGRLLHLDGLPDSVLVADPNVASFELPSPGNLFVYAKNVGTTTLYAMDENGTVINAIRIVSEHDLNALKERLKREFPNADIQLEAAIPSGVIVRGSVDTPQDAKRVIDSVQAYISASSSGGGGAGGAGGGGGGGGGMPGSSETSSKVVNQLKIKTPSQINIQVRVVEVSRKLTHELGFNWAASLSTGSGNLNAGSGSLLSLFDSSSGRFSSPTDTNYLSFGRSKLSGLLTAMNEQGMATVLAEPNLTAMSGETAAFAAGGEVPVVIITNNNVQIDYKSYGVILRMTPTLLSANRISLHIAPEVSELTDVGAVQLEGGSVIPALTVRRADTTVELASGQSFALAGMLRSANSQTVNGVPGLSGIPMFGRLFESEASSHEETELVIIATAYVVSPVNAGELHTPGQGVKMLDAAMPSYASAGYLY